MQNFPGADPQESPIDTDSIPPSHAVRESWWREPLLHFLAIGAALFLVYRVLNGGESTAPRKIVVTEARVEALAENFAKTRMRAPTPLELKGLVDDYIAEEAYYREAIAMGLDRDDTVIRRRLRQKMEFISDDLATSVPPTDSQLQAYLEQHVQRFETPPRVTFQQMYFSPQRRGAAARSDAERLLAELNSGRGSAVQGRAGDPTLLPAAMQSASAEDIANTFGAGFAEQVVTAPVERWTGPVESGYGLHLVRVDHRDAGALPTLAAIRPLVEREWEADRRKQANDAFIASLIAKYDVRIEGPFGELMRHAPTPNEARSR